MKANKPLLTFRVYPEGRFLYAVVNIWPTKKAMYAHKPLQRNHEASCTGLRVITFPPKRSGKPSRLRGVFAELNFYKRCLGAEVVSHEFTHAMFSFAERRRLNVAEAVSCQFATQGGKSASLDQEGAEERCCYALGRMYRQFVAKCYDRGIY